MAIIKQILTEGQILGFRGSVDFYLHRGRTVARTWPKKRTIPPRAAEKAGQTFFGRVQTKIRKIPQDYADQWRAFVRGTNIVWTDAIRFFTLTANHLKHVWPTVRWAHSIAYFDGTDWFFSHYFLPVVDDVPRISELWCASDYFSDGKPNISWRVVGQKRRRRAIISDQFRPAKYFAGDFGALQLDDTGLYWVKDITPDEGKGAVVVGLIPYGEHDWIHLQTPLVGFVYPSLSAGQKISVSPSNSRILPTPPAEIPPGHWNVFY